MMPKPMPELDGVKVAAANAVDELRPALERVALALHAEPELAYEEHKSAERLASLLTACGVPVRRPFAGLETSFAADLRDGGAPTVALCAEYDALPGIGHACGHNLMGTASVGAFL